MHRTLTVLALLVAPTALADDAPQAVADYRHSVMDATKYHMKAASQIVKGEISRPDDLVGHARALNDTAKMWDTVFPAGTGPDKVKTDTLPSVWEKWDTFVKANDAFEKATGELLAAAEKKDMAAAGAAMKALGASCGGCHDDFRKEE